MKEWYLVDAPQRIGDGESPMRRVREYGSEGFCAEPDATG